MSDLPKRGMSLALDLLHADSELGLKRVRDDIPDAAYEPADPSDWDGSPSTLKEAVDRLAKAISSGTTGSPIA